MVQMQTVPSKVSPVAMLGQAEAAAGRIPSISGDKVVAGANEVSGLVALKQGITTKHIDEAGVFAVVKPKNVQRQNVGVGQAMGTGPSVGGTA